ncbi:DUF6088 family protein [Sinomicrobium weinanense]|uniref:Transcriptional regulator, AbiEi antitoxin, Type IV TA system n=1 Tax=Sinomicrobium weinanense TaxID=2842200 RepID=A0A926JVT4_9FLAO|nr:DUF6088 family protein [Sinomicrobium weinanense]MBC9798239.1 hypothetical protein [Sinomicrobium weinanense]MBU3123257.1 hypothetical protein [Sinomicrobium weinanense]
MSIDNKIETRINKAKGGTIFFADDFIDLGNQSTIHTILHRLEKRKVLSRVAHGIYAKPKVSELLNQEILPSAEEIAKAIAKRDKAKLLPSGSYAQYALGLSTQVPLRLVYYTDGKTRTIKVGNRTIQFKRTSPKNLALSGKVSKLVVQALRDIGSDKVSPEEQEKIIQLLKKEDIKDLKQDIALAPQWIAEIMAKAL